MKIARVLIGTYNRIFDYNLWFEKIVFLNVRLNKIGIMGRLLSVIVGLLIRIIFNCDISPNIILGKKVKFPHAVGIVIGSTAIIGDNTVIMPNVVIGAKNYPPNNKKRHATIGKNCLIGTSAIILGDIHVGDNCVIAAGARVTKDLEENSKFI